MSPAGSRLLRAAVLGLALAALLVGPCLAERRVPPELVGAYCPSPAANGPWNAVAFAAAVGVVALLARRRT